MRSRIALYLIAGAIVVAAGLLIADYFRAPEQKPMLEESTQQQEPDQLPPSEEILPDSRDASPAPDTIDVTTLDSSSIAIVDSLTIEDSVSDDSLALTLESDSASLEPRPTVFREQAETGDAEVEGDAKDKVDDVQQLENAPEASLWMYILLVSLALSTIIASLVGVYLYRQKWVGIQDQLYVTPHEWGNQIENLTQGVSHFQHAMMDAFESVRADVAANSEKTAAMTETYMALQGALDEKDEQIRRLSKGYDSVIFRKFLLRFIRIDQTIDEFAAEEADKSLEMNQLKRLFEDALDECGVETFVPSTGGDYRTAIGVADHPKTVATDNPEQDFEIAEIIEPGYLLRNSSDSEVLIPAKVRIFRMTTEG